jgi:hypothetical protein
VTLESMAQVVPRHLIALVTAQVADILLQTPLLDQPRRIVLRVMLGDLVLGAIRQPNVLAIARVGDFLCPALQLVRVQTTAPLVKLADLVLEAARQANALAPVQAGSSRRRPQQLGRVLATVFRAVQGGTGLVDHRLLSAQEAVQLVAILMQ